MKQQCSKTKLGVSGVRMFQDSFMYLVQFSSVQFSSVQLLSRDQLFASP